MFPKILLTGGSGLFGTEFRKLIDCDAPSSKELNVLDKNTMIKYEPEVVIHAAAYTDVALAEEQKDECYKLNVLGTLNLAQVFHDRYFVYISSEYAVNPVNFYSHTKRWAEEMVQKTCKNHLIIRTLFKPRPYPYEVAFIDQYTNGDYVDMIAPKILNAVLSKHHGLWNIGTGRKTMFELARQSRPDVLGNLTTDIKGVTIPKDYQ